MVETGKSTDLAAAGRDLEAAQGRKVFVDHLEISRKGKWRGRCAHPLPTNFGVLATQGTPSTRSVPVTSVQISGLRAFQ